MPATRYTELESEIDLPLETAGGLAVLADLCVRNGPDSDEVARHLDSHRHLPGFSELAEESLRLERQYKTPDRLQGTGASRATHAPPAASPSRKVLGSFAWVAVFAASVSPIVLVLTRSDTTLQATEELQTANNTLQAKTKELDKQLQEERTANNTLHAKTEKLSKDLHEERTANNTLQAKTKELDKQLQEERLARVENEVLTWVVEERRNSGPIVKLLDRPGEKVKLDEGERYKVAFKHSHSLKDYPDELQYLAVGSDDGELPLTTTVILTTLSQSDDPKIQKAARDCLKTIYKEAPREDVRKIAKKELDSIKKEP